MRSASVALLVLALTGCSALFPPPASGPGGDDPFTRTTRRGVGHRYQVSLDVQCDQCVVTYTLGLESRTLTAGHNGWHEVFYRSPMMPETVRLAARSELGGSGSPTRILRRLSISVDGKVVARDQCEQAGMSGDCALEAQIVLGS